MIVPRSKSSDSILLFLTVSKLFFDNFCIKQMIEKNIFLCKLISYFHEFIMYFFDFNSLPQIKITMRMSSGAAEPAMPWRRQERTEYGATNGNAFDSMRTDYSMRLLCRSQNGRYRRFTITPHIPDELDPPPVRCAPDDARFGCRLHDLPRMVLDSPAWIPLSRRRLYVLAVRRPIPHATSESKSARTK